MELGNLHPLFVHLPIGILLLAFLMELFYFKKPKPKDNGTILFTLAVGALSAVFSTISGWLLGENGGYDEALLDKHRWIAVAFAVGAVGLFFLKKSQHKSAQKTYLPVFAVVLILLTLTGHYGGSLTHGEDFLFAKKYEEPVIENVDKAEVFAEVVMPILQKKCVSCHNSGKAKGGLLLTSQSQLLAGGDSGSLLDSLEQENASLLMHRIHLPLEEKEHMPPKGKVQLTSEEIMLLEWWMENNNCFDCLVEDLPHEGKLESVLAALEKDTSSQAQIAEKVDAVPKEFLQVLAQHNMSAQLISEEMPLLVVNFLQRKNLTEKDFEVLEEYKNNVVELNLGYTNFNDTLVKQLKSFKHLIKLQAQQTQITNESVAQLKGFKWLETLNLFGTALNDDALESIAKLPNLKKLYIWRTEMSDSGIASLKASNGAVEVQGQIADSVFAASNLGPPTILADREIFKDSIQIAMEQYFEGAKIFYVIEDTSKDTIPKEYKNPFYLDRTATIRAYTALENWEPSEESSADFLKNRVEISRVSLAKNPHPKYTAKGGKTLSDFKRGTTNFVDGNWLGYEAEHMTATVEFEEPTTISNVSVGILSHPTNWIFKPVGYTVWGSTDGSNFSRLKTIKLPKPIPSNDIERIVYNIDFEPKALKKVRLLVESPLKNPEWHTSPGGNSFIFVDELVFN